MSPTNYDFKRPLWQSCADCSREPLNIRQYNNETVAYVFIQDAERLKSAEGLVSTGLLLCPDAEDKRKRACNPKNHSYDVYVQSLSCRYWNNSSWVKDGCRVS